MDPNDWYAAEILVKERLDDLRRTAESLRSRDGRPRPSLRVVVRTTLARLALAVTARTPARGSGAGRSEPAARPVGRVPAGVPAHPSLDRHHRLPFRARFGRTRLRPKSACAS